MFDTFGISVHLPGNDNWIENREYRQPEIPEVMMKQEELGQEIFKEAARPISGSFFAGGVCICAYLTQIPDS